MIIIEKDSCLKIVSEKYIKESRGKKFKIIGQLEGEYPSLYRLEIKNKSVPEFLDYLNEKIKQHNKMIHTYKIQLKKFKDDLSILGVSK